MGISRIDIFLCRVFGIAALELKLFYAFKIGEDFPLGDGDVADKDADYEIDFLVLFKELLLISFYENSFSIKNILSLAYYDFSLIFYDSIKSFLIADY